MTVTVTWTAGPRRRVRALGRLNDAIMMARSLKFNPWQCKPGRPGNIIGFRGWPRRHPVGIPGKPPP